MTRQHFLKISRIKLKNPFSWQLLFNINNETRTQRENVITNKIYKDDTNHPWFIALLILTTFYLLSYSPMSSQHSPPPFESTNQSLTRVEGIDQLPDDLLMDIIKLSVDDPDTSPGILRISLLNRRFRFIALNTPSLWTKVPRIGGEFYNSFIERSKGRPLDVTIKIKKSYNPYEIEELDSILSSTSTERWRTVIILCARKYIITNEKFVEQRISPLTALHKLRKIKLPSLETLRYSLYGPVAVSYSCFYESEGSL